MLQVLTVHAISHYNSFKTCFIQSLFYLMSYEQILSRSFYCFKVNGYPSRGINFAIVNMPVFSMGSTLTGKNLLLEEHIFSCKSRTYSKRASTAVEVYKKLQKLFPFVKMAENMQYPYISIMAKLIPLEGYPFTLKHMTLNKIMTV